MLPCMASTTGSCSWCPMKGLLLLLARCSGGQLPQRLLCGLAALANAFPEAFLSSYSEACNAHRLCWSMLWVFRSACHFRCQPWRHCCPIISAKFAWRKNARYIKGLMSSDECNGSITFIKALLQCPGFSFL